MNNEPKDIVNLPVSILNWFRKAMPYPTDKNRAVQLGVHFEEVGEMCEALGGQDHPLTNELHTAARALKTSGVMPGTTIDRKELLDSLCDQIVTAIGVGYTQGFDMIGALDAVNANNWAKFVNGEPQWDENGKIKKPEGHTKVDLTPFLRENHHG